MTRWQKTIFVMHRWSIRDQNKFSDYENKRVSKLTKSGKNHKFSREVREEISNPFKPIAFLGKIYL